MWKDYFPNDCQEVVHVDEQSGEKHIADVKADSGVVVEVQHSPIAEVELRSRESFYDNMIWIVDARDLSGYFTLGTSMDLATCDPMTYHFEWWSRSTLLKRWAIATKPVFFDTQFVEAPIKEHVLWRLLEFDIVNGRGLIAPIRADWLVQAVLKGDSMPLAWCEQEDAWRYRRTMVEVKPQSQGATAANVPFVGPGS